MAKKYHLTLTQGGWFKDKKTYYNVPGQKVWNGLRYMSSNFQAPVVFVYASDHYPIGKNQFIGTYSAKYDNFRTPDKKLHKTFNFS
jgi:hypothetical protein